MGFSWKFLMRQFALISSCILAGCLSFSAVQANEQRSMPEWYLKTSLFVYEPGSDRVIQDTRSGVFGQLLVSKRRADRHDLAAWSSTDGSEASIVFEQTEKWGELAGDYLSDYRNALSSNERWLMTVTTRHENADVLLSWEDLVFLERNENGQYLESTTPSTNKEEKLDRRLRLIDLETGEKIRAFDKKTQAEGGYRFNMNGSTVRYFRWVRGKVRPSDYRLPTSPQNVAKSQSLMATQQLRAAATAPAGRFGAPPSAGQQTTGEQQ